MSGPPFPPPSNARLVPAGGDVLLLSMRRLATLVANCMAYEFEDVIRAVTAADRVEADNQAALDFSRRAYKLTRYLSGSRRLARALAPEPSVVRLERDYELLFAVLNDTYELHALASIRDWRKRCRHAVCFISEMWLHQMPSYLVEQLADFDHIFIGVFHCVDAVAKITGRPCTYLPPAADVLRFSPAPQFPERAIDVYNLGRRSQVTHRALLDAARDRQMFYCYDTVASSGIDLKQRTFHIQDAAEHRMLLANMLQRSRYYVANRARANEPEYTRGRDEISGRFFEGAAAGAVMIGEPPKVESFTRQFDWTDAVIPIPFDCPDIVQIIARLDADPQRVANIRRSNIVNAASRHDWLHRLRSVFDTLHLAPTPAMLLREERLKSLAALPASAWPEEILIRRLPLVSVPRTPLFSVVIPTRNRAHIIGRALRSVLDQTLEDYEMIVVDDGSTDSTSELLRSTHDAHCHAIRNDVSLGVAAARNRGVAAAKGEWIVFLDDDDALRRNALATLHERLAASPHLDFIWGGRLVHEIDSAGRYIALTEDDWSRIPSRIKGSAFLDLALQIATNSAFTIRRSVFEAVGGFDERLPMSEDRDLFITLARQDYVGAAIAENLIDVDGHRDSLSRGTMAAAGPAVDLRVIEKHRQYLDRPEHREFLDGYLTAVFAGFLRGGDRASAMRIFRELRRRGALNIGLLRQYVRHAPEFRALKSLLRYDSFRRIRTVIGEDRHKASSAGTMFTDTGSHRVLPLAAAGLPESREQDR